MILVTGATGHIGNVLIRELINEGFHNVAALVLPNEDVTPIADLPIAKIKGDVCDLGSLVKAFQHVDFVYHLAGLLAFVPGFEHKLEAVNVGGTENVLRACETANVRRMVYTSSVHAFEVPSVGTTVTESTPLKHSKHFNYDQSKAAATGKMLEAVRRGVNAIIVYPSGVIGPYDFRVSEMGKLLIDFKKGNLKAYVPGGYDFVDVRDVALGLIATMEKGERGESYILSGHRVSMREIMRMFEDITGAPKPKLVIPMSIARLIAKAGPTFYKLARQKPRFTPYSMETLSANPIFSNDKARLKLGFSTRSLRESFRDAYRWFREQQLV